MFLLALLISFPYGSNVMSWVIHSPTPHTETLMLVSHAHFRRLG